MVNSSSMKKASLCCPSVCPSPSVDSLQLQLGLTALVGLGAAGGAEKLFGLRPSLVGMLFACRQHNQCCITFSCPQLTTANGTGDHLALRSTKFGKLQLAVMTPSAAVLLLAVRVCSANHHQMKSCDQMHRSSLTKSFVPTLGI